MCAVAALHAGGCSLGDEDRGSAGRAPSAEEARTLDVTSPIEPRTTPQLILFISIDTLRADHLSLYGYDRLTSPMLDLLAAEGAVFEDASATAPWTLPSHASMLTGLFPLAHRVMTMKSKLPADVPTLASMLAQAGFDTAAVVNSTWLGKENYQLTRDFKKYLFIDAPEDRKSPNTWVTDQATAWLQEAGDQRMFLFVHYYDVHGDYSSLPEYERLFVTPYDGPADGSSWQLQLANFEDDYIEFCRESFDPEKCRFGGADGPRNIDASTEKIYFDEADVRHLEELYDAGIRQLDAEMSRLFSFLQQEELDDKTLIIITSDHGEEFLEHGRVDHFLTQYQEMLRVPLIFRGPGIPAGLRISTPVSSVDLVPTILKLAGAEVPPALDGLDLTPLFRGDRDEAEAAFAERRQYGEASGGLTYDSIVQKGLFPVYRSVRQGRYKLVYESKAEKHALYDLDEDPGEKVDISAVQPEISAQLIDVMRQRYRDYAPEPLPENRVELSKDDIERLRALGYIP